jgi:hypothetical protein
MDISTSDPLFLEKVERWFSEREEILALFQYSRAGGSKDWFLLRSIKELTHRLRELRPQSRVTLFRERQLPLRGVVDDALIGEALGLMPDGSEYLLLNLERKRYDSKGVGFEWSDFDADTSHEELSQELNTRRGECVAIGPYPPWLDDNEDVLVAIKPDNHGMLTLGVY